MRYQSRQDIKTRQLKTKKRSSAKRLQKKFNDNHTKQVQNQIFNRTYVHLPHHPEDVRYQLTTATPRQRHAVFCSFSIRVTPATMPLVMQVILSNGDYNAKSVQAIDLQTTTAPSI
eukprot:2502553-Amphidinium_carterae.1